MNDDLDPDKQSLLNQMLVQQMSQRHGGIPPSAGPSPAPAGGALPPPPSPTDIVPHGTTTAGPGESAAMSGSKDPESKIESSHPAQDLTQYIQGQEQQVDKFGPDKQAALMQHLQQGYKSPGNLLAKGGATLADAIMQGVARAGSSGNLSAINERENQNLDRAATMGKSLQEQNLAALKEKQGLEAQSGATPLGAATAPATSAFLSMIGVPRGTIPTLLKNPNQTLKVLDQFKEMIPAQMKTKIEGEMKMLELQIQGQRNDIESKRNTVMEGIEEQGKQIESQKAGQEAAGKIAQGSIIPFMGPSHAQKRAAFKTLAGALPNSGGFSPDVTAYAQRHGITPEQAQAIKDKRTGD